MKRTRCTEEQNIGVLKEAEPSAKTADLARRPEGCAHKELVTPATKREAMPGHSWPAWG